MIVAADHPARGALGVGDRKLAMANRADLLERLCLALSRPGVDGVLATADILDDLLLLGALDGKVVMGSMNRGGLAGRQPSSSTTASPATAPRTSPASASTPASCSLRIDYDDPGSLATLESTARAVDEMAERRLPVFVEPFISRPRPRRQAPQRPGRRRRHQVHRHRVGPGRHFRVHLAEGPRHRRTRTTWPR